MNAGVVLRSADHDVSQRHLGAFRRHEQIKNVLPLGFKVGGRSSALPRLQVFIISHVVRLFSRPGRALGANGRARFAAGLYCECVIGNLLLTVFLHTYSGPSRTTADTVRESAGSACSERWSIVWRLVAGLFCIARAAPGFVPHANGRTMTCSADRRFSWVPNGGTLPEKALMDEIT
jgi:hypothetical protein